MKVVTLLWDANQHSLHFSRCYDESWVEKLCRGFRRNTRHEFEFVLFTDKYRDLPYRQELLTPPYGYHSCIEPYRLREPMILVGLDTIVTGCVDPLFEYSGSSLLVPRDPNTQRACNAVVVYPGGDLWDRYDGSNDMVWTNRQPHEYLDDHFPGMVRSYKCHVKKMGLKDARIVYFHGMEKPHEIDHEVLEHWL